LFALLVYDLSIGLHAAREEDGSLRADSLLF